MLVCKSVADILHSPQNNLQFAFWFILNQITTEREQALQKIPSDSNSNFQLKSDTCGFKCRATIHLWPACRAASSKVLTFNSLSRAALGYERFVKPHLSRDQVTCGTLPFGVAANAGWRRDQSRRRQQRLVELAVLVELLPADRAPSRT